LYVVSARRYPARVPEPECPPNSRLRKVGESGLLNWRNRPVFISKLLGGECVGLVPTEEDFYEVYYGPLLLGWLDEENYFATDAGAEPTRQRSLPGRRPI
jgi:putative transposase